MWNLIDFITDIFTLIFGSRKEKKFTLFSWGFFIALILIIIIGLIIKSKL